MTDSPHENCIQHSALEQKITIGITFLGANLIGVVLIAGMMVWSQLKTIPEMEQRITDRIAPLQERIAKLEWRMDDVDRKQRATLETND